MTDGAHIAVPETDGAELHADESPRCSECRTVLKTSMSRKRGMCLRCIRAQRGGFRPREQAVEIDVSKLLDLADPNCEACAGCGYTLTDSLDPERIPCACTTRPGARRKPRPTGVRSIDDVEASEAALLEEIPDEGDFMRFATAATRERAEHRWQREDASDGPGDVIVKPPEHSSPLNHVSSRGAMPVFFGRAPEKKYEPIPDNIAELAEAQERQQRAATAPTAPNRDEVIASIAPARVRRPRRPKEQPMRVTEGTSDVPETTAKEPKKNCSGCDKQLRGESKKTGKCFRCRLAAGEVEKPERKAKPSKAPRRVVKAVELPVRPESPAPFDPTKLSDEQLDLARIEHVKRHGEPAPVTVDRPWSDEQVRGAFWERGLFAASDVENLDWTELEAAVAEIEQRCAAGDALRARVRKLAGR